MIGGRVAALVVGAALVAARIEGGDKPLPYVPVPAAAAVLAAEPGTLTFTFIGNMAVAITDGKTTLYTDFPYESGSFGYMSYDFARVTKGPEAICLVTHGHRDHFDDSLFADLNAAIVAPPSLAARLPNARVLPFGPRIVYRDIAIEPVATRHGDIEHYSYLVTWKGRRLYFSGDTDDTKALLAAKNLDVAFVSPWLIGAVAEKGGRIDTRRLIAYHHMTGEDVPSLQDRLVPKQGETWALEPATAAGAPR